MLSLAVAPSALSVSSETRDDFRACYTAYSRGRSFNRGDALGPSQIKTVIEIVWYLGVWPELVNELVMADRLYLYDDLIPVIESDPLPVLSFRDPIVMLGALHRFLGEEHVDQLTKPVLVAVAA